MLRDSISCFPKALSARPEGYCSQGCRNGDTPNFRGGFLIPHLYSSCPTSTRLSLYTQNKKLRWEEGVCSSPQAPWGYPRVFGPVLQGQTILAGHQRGASLWGLVPGHMTSCCLTICWGNTKANLNESGFVTSVFSKKIVLAGLWENHSQTPWIYMARLFQKLFHIC